VKCYLLDTGIAGDYIDRRNGVFERARREVAKGRRVGICVPVLCELYYGVEHSKSREKNWQRLLAALPSLSLWPLTLEAAAEYGRIASRLDRRGRPMQQIDIQIAAIALTVGNCTVVSSDTDLSAVPGLSVEDWSTS
jgi:tRNA(fMet)-specific endonuclease VapC